MKNYFFTLILSIFITGIATGQEFWYWQNPIPQGNELNDLWSFNGQSAIAVGDVGTVIKTDDGGVNWTVKHYCGGVHGDLLSVYFIDPKIGWAGGTEGKILKTIDGGDTWSVQTIENVISINGLFFHDSQRGWAVGNKVHLDGHVGVILKTTDGGSTWSVEEPPYAANLNAIHFFNQKVGWTVGSKYIIAPQNPEDIILRTEDGGMTWQPQFSRKTTELFCTCFVDSLHGWAVGKGISAPGAIIYTKDSGITWEIQSHPLPTKIFWTIRFRDLNLGWAAGEAGSLLKTTDGGKTWEEQNSQVSRNLNAIRFTGSQIVMAVGNAGIIIKSQDNGSVWQEISSGTTTTWLYYSVDFTDPDTGWIVGPNKTIMKSVDGGIKWTAQVSPGSERLLDIFFVNNQIGWTVGEGIGQGVILHTTDGGDNWIDQIPGTTSALFSCCFYNEQIGWACGGPVNLNESTILYTSDGGNQWTGQNSPANATLRDICFTDGVNGWAVGDQGGVVHTTDGGLNWSLVSLGTSDNFYSVFFINKNYGWIGGSSILKTTDGGKNWVEQLKFAERREVHDIHFIDPYLGWAVVQGNTGALFKTFDGGANWFPLDIGTVNNLYNICFVNDQIGWVVGTSSTILKTDAIVVPVELASFNANWTAGQIELNWATTTESNNYGFEIQRKSDRSNSWQKIGFVEGHGTTTQMNYYSFVDKPRGGGKYSYRLKQLDIDGKFDYSPISEVTVPNKFALYQNHPNPFNSETTISFELAVSAQVILEIYNMLGQKIATLMNEHRPAGVQQIIWNGKDDAGRAIGSGVYFYHLKSDRFEATKKLVLLL